MGYITVNADVDVDIDTADIDTEDIIDILTERGYSVIGPDKFGEGSIYDTVYEINQLRRQKKDYQATLDQLIEEVLGVIPL